MQIDRKLGGWILTYFVLAALVVFVARKAKEPREPRRVGAGGTVRRVIDGDTVDLRLTNGSELRVRLFGIDAPERGQPFYNDAKEHLNNLLETGEIALVSNDTDRYGRTLGTLFNGSTNLCLEMVRSGLAWHFKRYSTDTQLAEAENAARFARAGLWRSTNNLIPPWEFRANQRN